MSPDSVLVTGGKGLVGEAVADEFDRHGYHVVTVDAAENGDAPGPDHYTVDLLDPGAVHGTVSRERPDAIVHLGTHPHPMGRPGHETYESNAMTTYNILEAAAATDIETVVIASSINAMGAVFQEAPIEVEYLPVDEDHPLTPRDPYALGKRTLELQAEGFARRQGPPYGVLTLRLPYVAPPDKMREYFAEPERTLETTDEDDMAAREDLYTYIARSDAARAFRKGVEADVHGHESVFVTADDTTMETKSPAIAEAKFPQADTNGLSGRESLVSNERAKEILDWAPRVSWQSTLESNAPAGDSVTSD